MTNLSPANLSCSARWVFNALLLLALASFLYGVFAPLMRLEKFWFFNNEYSLYSSLQTLYEHEEIFLLVVLFLFSVLTPLVKMFCLALLANTSLMFRQRRERLLYLLETWGKWSMLDVFVVALLFVAVKLGALVNVTIHSGLYWFGGAVLLIQLLSVWLSWSVNRKEIGEGWKK